MWRQALASLARNRPFFSQIRRRWDAGAQSLAGGLSQLPPHTLSRLGRLSAACVGLCELERATVNGSASDMNLSPAAGWEGEGTRGRGCECLMHPATTQQFALKSLLPI